VSKYLQQEYLKKKEQKKSAEFLAKLFKIYVNNQKQF
jgi:hypothetical protein